jgi:hypothetical protein
LKHRLSGTLIRFGGGLRPRLRRRGGFLGHPLLQLGHSLQRLAISLHGIHIERDDRGLHATDCHGLVFAIGPVHQVHDVRAGDDRNGFAEELE